MNIRFLLVLGVLAVNLSATAQTFTWTGGGADDNLSTANNWGGTAPSANANLVFTGGVRLTPTVSANYTAGSITFNNLASAFTISGPNNRTLTVGTGGILNNSTNTQTFAAKITLGNTTVDASSAGFVFSSAVAGQNVLTLSGNATFTGSYDTTINTKLVTGTGQITKNGAGTLTLGAANTYSGGTTLNAGTLRVNNATGSGTGTGSVNVNGGRLVGSGTISGAVNLNTGGTISAGSIGVGQLTTGAQTWNGGATYLFDIAAASGTAGIDWDLLNIAGGVTIAANAGNMFNIDITGNPAGFDNSFANQWTIATATGGFTGFDPAGFNIMTSNFGGDPGTGTFFLSLANGNQDLVLNFAPVPEPSTIALSVIGGLALIGNAIRRRRKN